MPDSANPGAVTWLVFVYQPPAKPAGLRALVRRRLGKAGAVYLSQACAVAPAGPAERVMRRMRTLITDAGGAAVLMRACAVSGGPELTAAFNAARDREYDAVISACGDAVSAVETMIAAGDFGYERLSASEAVLKRLDTRCLAIAEHDVLGAGQAAAAASALAWFRSVLDEYARRLR